MNPMSDMMSVIWKDDVFRVVRWSVVGRWFVDGWEFVGTFRESDTD
jgi:hypothetical protein